MTKVLYIGQCRYNKCRRVGDCPTRVVDSYRGTWRVVHGSTVAGLVDVAPPVTYGPEAVLVLLEKAKAPPSVAAQVRAGSVEVQPRDLPDPLCTIRPEHLRRHESHHKRMTPVIWSPFLSGDGRELLSLCPADRAYH